MTRKPPTSISFTYDGQMPSKSNVRFSRGKHRKASGRRWAAIKKAEEDVGNLAREAWQNAGGRGSMVKLHADKVPIVTILCVNQRMDAANAPKLICDALEHVCYENDKTVGAFAMPPKTLPGVKGYVRVTVDWKEIES